MATIVQGLPKQIYDELTIDFKSYSQVNRVSNNTTNSRTAGVIAILSARERGGYYFMYYKLERNYAC